MKVFPATLGGNLATFHWIALGFCLFMVVSLLAVIVIIGMHTGWEKKPMRPVGIGVMIPVIIILGVLFGSYLYAPRSFSVSEDGVRINRFVSPIFIPIRTIKGVRQARREDLQKSLRTFGVGGLFGSFGNYYSKGLGSYRLYATNYENAVILYAGEIYVLTPDQSLEFIEAVQTQLQARRFSLGR